MHSVCPCSLPVWRRSFVKKGTPCDLFCPALDPPLGQIWLKNNNTCKGPWVLHPYQVSSKSIKRFWRSRKCESLQTTTDGRRTAMTIAHSSLWLRWAKKKTMGTRGFKSRVYSVSPCVSENATKMGRFLGITVKRLTLCRCLDGHVKEPYEMSMALGARP